MLNTNTLRKLLYCFALAGLALRAAEVTPTAEQVAFFEKDVQPLLKANCFKCHGAEAKVKAGLYLTSRAGMLKGGTTGPAIDEKAPEKSIFLEMLSFKDEEHSMPPDGKLKPEQLAILTKWIKTGAPWKPGTEARTARKRHRQERTRTESQNRRRLVGVQKTQTACRSRRKKQSLGAQPDRQFHSGRARKGGPAPVPPRRQNCALIRRAYYDVTGLPPTPG